ncbi:hypothetical protein B7494_g3895 [Chlorociboria aeruginascens]|nr:hypothetical protein B7494_g3895 [Chlorociboria aeruginascens]
MSSPTPSIENLPSSHSSNIHITQPTLSECEKISTLTWHSWGDALTLPQYLQEARYLNDIPLAKDGGLTAWILTTKDSTPNERLIFSSCETYRKRAFVSDGKENVKEETIHAIASVFCNPEYRGRGYASRMLKELGSILKEWQIEEGMKCMGSMLYSDLGKNFYAKLGWDPMKHNIHLEFSPSQDAKPLGVREILDGDLEELCRDDEIMVREEMVGILDSRTRVMIVPNVDHMRWHHGKEEFASEKLFRKIPYVKGAVVGEPGNRTWAIWTHRFYEMPKNAASPTCENSLYILRLVVENKSVCLSNDETALQSKVSQLKDILQSARVEAAQWNLPHIKLWSPAPFIEDLIEKGRIPYRKVDRENDSITSILWYREENSNQDLPELIGDEKYAWC